MTSGSSRLAATTRADAVLRQLELLVTRRLDGLLQGDFQGLVPGAGSEAGDGRVYLPGDDVRRMDWNLTARTTVPHVRETIIDRELETWLLLDGSASLDFGTADCEKRDLALFAAAAVGFLTGRQGNRLGTMLATPAGTITRPPRSGRTALLARLHELAAYRAPDASEGTPPADLTAAMDSLRRIARRRGLVVVLSDFLEPRDWERPFRGLAAFHDVLAVEVVDPRELELPPVGLLMLVDPETGRRVEVQTRSAKLRARFATAAANQRSVIAEAIRRAGVEHVQLRTDRDWLQDIVRFVVARRRRRAGRPVPVR
ncbi:MAG TPA: DUF58 domain-containing protein [Acidimicrobiia bacterium]|nr:DUF58 domain-containing protein [Acidimicrobiia bacterium]